MKQTFTAILALLIGLTIGLMVTHSINDQELIKSQMEVRAALKDALYYQKQYLKANTQLIELKSKCIYCVD